MAASGLVLGLGACRPIFVIGWGELLILFLIVAFLLGPILWRFFRAWNATQEPGKKEREK
jgi:membrane protein implicated in regulation of membrane protease activity